MERTEYKLTESGTTISLVTCALRLAIDGDATLRLATAGVDDVLCFGGDTVTESSDVRFRYSTEQIQSNISKCSCCFDR